MRYRHLGSCGRTSQVVPLAGTAPASKSTSRSTVAPWRSANEVNSRSEAVLSGRDGGLDGGEPLLGGDPGGQPVEQGGGQPAPAVGLRRRPPARRRRVLGPVGPDVPGDEADRLAVRVPGDRGGGGEVTAPQQVAVRGVEVEDLGVAGDAPDRGPVLHSGVSITRGIRFGHLQGLSRAAVMRIEFTERKSKLHRPSGVPCGALECVITRAWAPRSRGVSAVCPGINRTKRARCGVGHNHRNSPELSELRWAVAETLCV